MNFLAHIYLSGSDPQIKVGNFIGDHVKGNAYLRFAPAVQKGILLHRRIDDFTDRHPLFRESSLVFRERYGRYAFIVTDVVYDHLLATNWERYSTQPLRRFVSQTHRILLRNYFSLPQSVRSFLPFMIKSRRLEHYRQTEGIAKALSIMADYTSLPAHSDWAVKQLIENRTALESQFFAFFEDIQSMCVGFLVTHVTQNSLEKAEFL
ncbi:MAG: ACP phosphodiesterase [Cytophagaceae bacterium]|nr:ACP phosphodiesterase [Cytophagaceae bacterium]